MALLYDPNTGTAAYRKSPLVSDGFGQFREKLKGRQRGDEADTELKRQRAEAIRKEELRKNQFAQSKSKLMELVNSQGSTPLAPGDAPSNVPPDVAQVMANQPPPKGPAMPPELEAAQANENKKVSLAGGLSNPAQPNTEPPSEGQAPQQSEAVAQATAQEQAMEQLPPDQKAAGFKKLYMDLLQVGMETEDPKAIEKAYELAGKAGFPEALGKAGAAGNGVGKTGQMLTEFINIHGRRPNSAQEWMDYLDKRGATQTMAKHPDELAAVLETEAGAKAKGRLTQEETFAPRIAEGRKSGEMEASGDIPLTIGQRNADRTFGNWYADHQQGGGFSNGEEALRIAGEVKDALQENTDLTGKATMLTPDALRKLMNQNSVFVQQKMEELKQLDLRPSLGAAFTEKEGDRLISRAYDPALEESFNIQKVDNFISGLKGRIDAQKALVGEWENNGTISGYKSQPAPAQADEGQAPAAETPTARPKRVWKGGQWQTVE